MRFLILHIVTLVDWCLFVLLEQRLEFFVEAFLLSWRDWCLAERADWTSLEPDLDTFVVEDVLNATVQWCNFFSVLKIVKTDRTFCLVFEILL